MKNRHHRRCIIGCSRLYPVLMTATAPIMSQCTITDSPCQCLAQTAHASMTGTSSFHSMLWSLRLIPAWLRGGHGNCNHQRKCVEIAPYPYDPDASVHISVCEEESPSDNSVTPFQDSIKIDHHRRSDRNDTLSRM